MKVGVSRIRKVFALVVILFVGMSFTSGCVTSREETANGAVKMQPLPDAGSRHDKNDADETHVPPQTPPSREDIEDWHREEQLADIVNAFAGEGDELRFEDIYDDHWTWTYVGFAMLRSGRYAHAIRSYRRALSINPSFSPAIYNMACAASLSERGDEALEIIQLLGSKVDGKPSLMAKYADFLDTDPDLVHVRTHPRFPQARRLFSAAGKSDP